MFHQDKRSRSIRTNLWQINISYFYGAGHILFDRLYSGPTNSSKGEGEVVPPILGIFLVRKAPFSALFSLFLNFSVPCFSRFDAKTPFLAPVGEFFSGLIVADCPQRGPIRAICLGKIFSAKHYCKHEMMNIHKIQTKTITRSS